MHAAHDLVYFLAVHNFYEMYHFNFNEPPAPAHIGQPCTANLSIVS